MARTESTMLELGTPAPAFRLPEPASGREIALEDFKDTPALLVMFLCNHCPYVQHLRHKLAEVVRRYQPKGLAAVGINANDVDHYPDDAPEKMVEEVRTIGYTFPYLYDASQEVAKAYRAACTPDFFLFDGKRRLVYRGQFDAARPRSDTPVTGKDLSAAVEAVLAGRPVPAEQRASLGCNIKWKPGNGPDYFG
ncbi:MAG: thioredoxin family protein [Chromatiales bacterium 21-64-14]|nr:MAG: thioredoxin family protein [Chromatiales bacterium 21-64-14]HQU15177.1 thioredoxin family protein [Gammaproteobacteria bacterium]